MEVSTGSADHWYQVTLGFVCRPAVFVSEEAGIQSLPARLTLGSLDEGRCETSVSIELHEADVDEKFDEHLHFRFIVRRCGPEWDPEGDSASHEHFLRGLGAAFQSDEALSVTVVGHLRLPTGVSWRLPILTAPPDVSGESEELGSVSLAGVTLDFSESQLGLERVFMESDFDGEPTQFKIMHRFSIAPSEMVSIISVGISQSERLAAMFVEGLAHE